MDNGDRHSQAQQPAALPILTAAQKAQQEAANTLQQYDHMRSLIDSALSGSGGFRIRPSQIQKLNRYAIENLESQAGNWRTGGISIGKSSHIPPPYTEISELIDEFCEYINDNWNVASALHLAAYAMWRLNWIHPFVDGNGRTTRAVSYYVLCAKMGFRLPGSHTIPEIIAANKRPYYEALESADAAHKNGIVDVSQMEALLKNALADQLLDAIRQAADPSASVSPTQPANRSNVTTLGAQAVDSGQFLPKWAGLGFAAATVIFMGVLIAKGDNLSKSSSQLMVMLFALSGAVAVGLIGGEAGVRGTVTVGSMQKNPIRFAATGGVAVLVILLLLGWMLFL